MADINVPADWQYDFTEEEAIAIAESGVWKTWSTEECLERMLHQGRGNRTFMDFGTFHRMLEHVLRRDIVDTEFRNPAWLYRQYMEACS